jgi:hypothetical protein
MITFGKELGFIESLLLSVQSNEITHQAGYCARGDD